jgi:hypothetical protein
MAESKSSTAPSTTLFSFFSVEISLFFTQKQFDVIHRVCNNIIRIRTSVQEAGDIKLHTRVCIFSSAFLFSPFAVICVYFSCTLIIVIYNNKKKSSRIFSAVVCVTRGASIDADSLIITKKHTHILHDGATHIFVLRNQKSGERDERDERAPEK